MTSLNDLGKQFVDHAEKSAKSYICASSVSHMRRIAQEVEEARQCDHLRDLPGELADIILATCTAAAKFRIDLDHWVAVKHKRNLASQWESDNNGNVRRYDIPRPLP